MSKLRKALPNSVFLKSLYFSRYFACGLFIAFFSLMLYGKGLTESEMGMAFSIQTFVSLASHLILISVCKNANQERMLLKISIVLEGLCVILFIVVKNFIFIAIAAALYQASRSTESMIDGYTQTYCIQTKDRYASYRFFGSLGYGLGALASGYIIEYSGYNLMLLASGIIYIVSSFISYFTKPISEDFLESKTKKRNFKEILNCRMLYVYLIFNILCLQLPTSLINYLGIFMKSNYQVSDSLYGWLSSIVVFIECFLLIIDKKFIKKEYALVAIIIGSFFYIIRLFMFGFNPPLWVAIIAYLFQGISTGLTIGFASEFVAQLLGKKNYSSGALLISIISLIFRIIIDYVVGLIFDNYSYLETFKYSSIGMLVVFFIFVIVFVILKKKKIFKIETE